MNTAEQRNSAEQRERADLARTVGNIFVAEAAAEPWTKEIARRTNAVMCHFYGEVYETLVEHIVCEALAQISFHLRQGYPVALEQIGTLVPTDHKGQPGVLFEPYDVLLRPMPEHPRNAAQLTDRRRAQGGNRA